MRKILTDEEKKTPMGQILLQFKYYQLTNPEVREKLEKKITEKFGNGGYSMIKSLENCRLLPKTIKK